jgi:MoxR-like ATPase
MSVATFAESVLDEVGRAVVGKREALSLVLAGILAKGHILLEDFPGLGKTLAARSFAGALGLDFARAQFTPDLLPADLTGSYVYDQRRAEFDFRPGPIFTGLLLADEINRTPPKTQAALLEAMQEKSVTVGKKTYKLEEPFMVMATQNPIEQEGTYPLPEAQLDRFMLLVRVEYPKADELKEIIRASTAGGFKTPESVLDAETVLQIRKTVRMVPISDHVLNYIVKLVIATHPDDEKAPEYCKKYLSWGAGPRAGQCLSLCAKSRALLRGNLQATIEDVRAVAHPVLRHRIVTNFTAQAEGVDSDDIIDKLLASIPDK